MNSKKIGIILCATLNIVAGAAATFAGGVLMFLAIGFGASPLEAMLTGALFLAGVLYACAGVCFALSNQRAWSAGLLLQGLTILLGAAWVVLFLIASKGNPGRLNPGDEEVFMFFFLPAAGVLLAIAEFGLLCWIRPRVVNQPAQIAA